MCEKQQVQRGSPGSPNKMWSWDSSGGVSDFCLGWAGEAGREGRQAGKKESEEKREMRTEGRGREKC